LFQNVGRVGLGQNLCGSGRVGSKKIDPRRTLAAVTLLGPGNGSPSATNVVLVVVVVVVVIRFPIP